MKISGLGPAFLTLGNHGEVELSVDASDAWKTDPQLVASGGPLEL
jgi:hypothetical protein